MATKKHPGRPRLDANDPSVPMSVSLPSKKFDELCALALREGIGLPEVVRRMIYGQTEKKPKK